MSFFVQKKTNWKYLAVVIIFATAAGVIILWCAKPVRIQELKNWSMQEQLCLISGGKVSVSLCCKLSNNFPDSCLIGACGCSPDNSREIKICDCGIDKCFNGIKCVSQKK